MTEPRLVPPTNAASGTVAMTCTAAVRRPAATRGSASGSSTSASERAPDMPIPRAASRTSASTSSTPVYALVRIGGTANTATASVVAVAPNSPPDAKIVSSANVGSARDVFASTTVSAPPLRRCPSHTPSGRAMTAASSTAATEIVRCSRVSASTPWVPVQFRGSFSHATASETTFIARPSCRLRRAGPRREQSTHAVQDEVGRERERQAQERGREDLGVVAAAEPAEHELTEPAVPDDDTDRHERDRRDGREPHAGDDGRQRVRQLDPQEQPGGPVPEAARRVAHLVRDTVEPDDDVAHEHEQRVRHESDEDRGAADACERRQNGEERDRRDRVEHTGQPHERRG